MKHRTLILLCALLCGMAATYAATTSAASILNTLRSRITGKEAVEAVFTINGNSGKVQGSVVLAGPKFVMTTPQVSVWYDGRTQWVLTNNSQEVTINEPDEDALLESNPFAILSAQADRYKARRLPDIGGCYRVELSPTSRTATVSRYVITVDQKTGWPKRLNITLDDGQEMDVTVDNISTTPAKADKFFKYDKAKYPTFEIIDLR